MAKLLCDPATVDLEAMPPLSLNLLRVLCSMNCAFPQV